LIYWDNIKELFRKQHSTANIQQLIRDSKHLKDQQDIADAFNNYFFSMDKISKYIVDNKINGENLSTFHYYLEQNYVNSSLYLVFKTFSTKKLHL
jgi:hypothetical protein